MPQGGGEKSKNKSVYLFELEWRKTNLCKKIRFLSHVYKKEAHALKSNP